MNYDIDKWDMEDLDDAPLNKKNKKDVKMAREYCDQHEQYHGDDTCEPIWDKDTGELDIYEVIIHPTKKAKLDFVKKRNKENEHTPKKFKKKR